GRASRGEAEAWIPVETSRRCRSRSVTISPQLHAPASPREPPASSCALVLSDEYRQMSDHTYPWTSVNIHYVPFSSPCPLFLARSCVEEICPPLPLAGCRRLLGRKGPDASSPLP